MPVEAATLISIAGFAAGAIGSKAIGDGAARAGQEIIAHFRKTLPGQQEFIRDILKAQLTALKRVAEHNDQALKQVPRHDSTDEEHSYASVLRGFVDARVKTLSGNATDIGVLTADRIQDVLDFMIHPSPDAPLADLQVLARGRAEAAIIAEIEADAGRAMPTRLRHLIEGTGGEGWYDFFSAEVNEQLKTNERFKSVFLFARLADIRHEIRKVGAKVDSVPDQTVAKLLAALPPGDAAAAREAGVREGMIVALARRVEREVKDFDAALATLENAVEIAIKVMQEGTHRSNSGDFVDEVLARVAERMGDEDFEGARAIADDAVAKWEREEEERRNAEAQKGLILLRTALRQAELAFDAAAAADRLTRIAELEHPGDRAAQRAALRERWDANEEEGRIRGNPFAMKTAAEIAGRLLNNAETAKEQSDCSNLLGNALSILGERAGGADGIDALNQAVAAYQNALQVRTRAEMPADWAMTQNNLGNALQTLGARAGGADGIDALNRAVAAYENALQIRTRAEMPADWAMTQNNLGNALSILGERAGGADGIDVLNRAVAAHENALQVRTRAEMPADWATTQNNLGNALRTLGARTGGVDGIDALNRAIAAYQNALRVRTRAEMPADWAGTQNNLGNALQTLGARAGGADGIDALNRAVGAYEAALLIYSQAEMPADWAMTQNNLGATLQTLGERAGGADGIDALNRAVAAHEQALLIYSRAEMPADWATTQNNLGNALRTLGARTGGADGIDALNRAVAAYENALQVRTRAEMPADWAGTQNNLGNALSILGERAGGADGIDVLNRAVGAYENSLQVRTRTEMPADWAMTQNNLGNALKTLGARTGGADGIDALNRAIAAYQNALLIFDLETAAYFAEGVNRNLERAREVLARLQGG